MTHDTPQTTAQDPVCGMVVDSQTTKHTSEYRGRTYYFCSLMCRKAFEDEPERYLKLHPQSSVQNGRRNGMSEAWQRDPRTVAERLVERGSVYDVEALETIYDDDQYLVFVETGGSIRRLGRAENLALFREWAKSGATPLLPEAEVLHIEEARDNAMVLLRRRMHANEPSRLYELRLRKSGDVWKVSGETVTPWPGADDVPSDM